MKSTPSFWERNTVESGIPWWVAAITAIGGTLLLPFIDRVISFFKSQDEKLLALKASQDARAAAHAATDDLKDQQFMQFLKAELDLSRKAEASCQENYMRAMQQIHTISSKLAKLEAIVMHLHPEIAAELMKDA
jgi:hypothetical protein